MQACSVELGTAKWVILPAKYRIGAGLRFALTFLMRMRSVNFLASHVDAVRSDSWSIAAMPSEAQLVFRIGIINLDKIGSLNQNFNFARNQSCLPDLQHFDPLLIFNQIFH